MNTPLTPESILRGLDTRYVGRVLLCYDSVTSTMDVARREALRGTAEGTAAVAERQTAGRGRLKRAWHTPEGNIAVSVVLYPPLEFRNQLIMLASLAVLNSIRSVTGLSCTLKWPNDVQIDGRKVCGILIETSVRADRLEYAILGIGVNVNMRLADFPDIQPIATSLSDRLGHPVDRAELLRSLFTELERLYDNMKPGGSLFPAWRTNLSTLGKKVLAQVPDGAIEGVAEGAEEDGSLLLRSTDGSLKRITIGDVSLREKTNG